MPILNKGLHAMPMLLRVLLLVVAQLATTPVHAGQADALAHIGAQIEQHAVLRAEFTQTKQVAAMKRPLVTKGALVYARNLGVLWQIEQPYRVSYVLGEAKIVEIDAQGVRRERSLREVPGLAQVGRIFRAMLGADTSALAEYFEASVQGDTRKWDIDLKPRQQQLAQFLTTLHVSGGRFVSAIQITEASGDTTLIRLHNAQGANALSDDELRLFGSAPVPNTERSNKP